MRKRLLLACVLIGISAFGGRPHAQAPTAVFYGIGQLPGLRAQPSSIVRDATQVGGVIYAVGGATTRLCSATSGLCGDTDTAVLWRFDGTNPAGLQALPNIAANTLATTPLTAYAITHPDAAFIASQARNVASGGTRVGVRVDAGSLTNVNLAGGVGGLNAATAISSDGTVLYGSTNEGTSNPSFPHRGYRLDPAGIPSPIPFLFPTDTWNPVAERGTSASGSVAVGSSFAALGANHRAYRYEHGVGVSAIPLLNGGTFNDAVAVSPDGDLVLVTGNSTANPNGEAYLWRASTNVTTPLGSPNTGLFPGAKISSSTSCLGGPVFSGGMTADGSVVAMSFFGGGCGGTTGYFRNAHGWFHLKSVLAAHGVDFVADGWDTGLQIHGISSDGTLVFGAGVRNGTIEGFVATFGVEDLRNFNPQAAPPLNTSLVGVWTFDPNLSNPSAVVVFTADGVYYEIEEGQGFERGLYTFDGSNVSFTTLVDTNGFAGLSDDNGLIHPVGVPIGDELRDGNGDAFAHRFPGAARTIAGAWVNGNPTLADSSFVGVFLGSANGSKFFTANDNPEFGDDGIEVGTYTWDPDTYQLDLTPFGGTPDVGNFATPAPNGLSIHVLGDDGDELDLARVIDPATIPVISNTPLTASGVVGQAFSYDVDATNTATFSATGLPGGLSINSGIGVITGAPSIGGQFAVTITATSAIGVSDIETLTLTVAIPTPIGQNVIVEPEVSEGQGPVTMTFGEITSAGTTTVTVVDQSEVPAPGNVDVGGVIYEVTTTATYQGLITLCFSYAGIDFGAATPRLFHYENNEWVDITTSVDTNTQTICGATTSLSPFAVLVSHVVRTGFYAPVNPIAGFLNTVKGGATVPLKFNVSIDSIAKKTTDGLQFTVQTISCDSTAPLDQVDFTVAGETSLRYDATAGLFIQNWKVPKTPGCYMVRMTTQQDALALTARFKVK